MLDSAVRTDVCNVAKGYNVLAGFIRDLRNAVGDDADGSAAAGELLDSLQDLLELLLEGGHGDISPGPDSDESTLGDESEDDVESVSRGTRERPSLPSMVPVAEAPAQYRSRRRGGQGLLPGTHYVTLSKGGK